MRGCNRIYLFKWGGLYLGALRACLCEDRPPALLRKEELVA